MQTLSAWRTRCWAYLNMIINGTLLVATVLLSVLMVRASHDKAWPDVALLAALALTIAAQAVLTTIC